MEFKNSAEYGFSAPNDPPPSYQQIQMQPPLSQYPQFHPTIIQPGIAPLNPQVIYNPQYPQITTQGNINRSNLKNPIFHFKFGITLILIGIFTCMIDPLVPILLGYPHSIVIAGLFMIISGATSVDGSKRMNKCSLVASMVFDILASINLVSGIITGIMIVMIQPKRSNPFAIYNIAYCGLLFFIVICDSAFKCRDTCCGQKPPANIVYYQVVPNNSTPH